MLTFFRRIRKGLIDSSSARKYLLYAVGEILLVMIGILLALQVNNWNGWRKDRILEKALIIDIRDNLERNVVLLNQYVEQRNAFNRSSKIILDALNHHISYSDSLTIHFFPASFLSSETTISRSGYESLKNAGLQLLSSPFLKKEIIYLFENVYPSVIERSDQASQTHEHFHKFLTENFNLTNSQNGIALMTPVNYSNLQEDHYYKTSLNQLIGSRDWIIRQLEECILETQRVLHLIKEELGEE